MRFLYSVTVPKNVNGGTLCDFSTSLVLQNIETNEGVTLWCNPKRYKKSHSAEKSGTMWGFLVCFRGSGRLLEMLRFDVVEQMNKKVDLTRFKKKLPTVTVGHIFY